MSDFLGALGLSIITVSLLYLVTRAVIWLALAGPTGIAVLGLCVGLLLVALAVWLEERES